MTEGNTAPGRLRLQAIAVIIAASLIGGLVGVTAERAFNSRRAPPPGRFAEFGPRDPGRLPGPLGRMNLTEEQRTEIHMIFEEWEPRTRAVMEEMMPRIQSVRDSVRIAVEAVLTEEQKEQLAEIVAARNGWGDWNGRRPPGFRGRPRPGGRGFRPDSQ